MSEWKYYRRLFIPLPRILSWKCNFCGEYGSLHTQYKPPQQLHEYFISIFYPCLLDSQPPPFKFPFLCCVVIHFLWSLGLSAHSYTKPTYVTENSTILKKVYRYWYFSLYYVIFCGLCLGSTLQYKVDFYTAPSDRMMLFVTKMSVFIGPPVCI